MVGHPLELGGCEQPLVLPPKTGTVVRFHGSRLCYKNIFPSSLASGSSIQRQIEEAVGDDSLHPHLDGFILHGNDCVLFYLLSNTVLVTKNQLSM